MSYLSDKMLLLKMLQMWSPTSQCTT